MELPRAHVVINPAASNGRAGRLWPRLQSALDAVLPAGWSHSTTAGAGGGTPVTREAIRAGARLIVSVGGDGTLNEVVNGLFEGTTMLADDLHLGVIPVGTGGDYRRTFGIGKDPLAAVARLASGTSHPVDLGRLTCRDDQGRQVTHHFANIASFGASGVIVKKVNTTTKLFGGKVSFMLGTLRGLMDYDNELVRITVDDHEPVTASINTVAVAIGTCFGGGMQVAARAVPDDGLFDVVIITTEGVLRFIRDSGSIYAGTHLDSDEVQLLRGRQVEAMPVTADGEPSGACVLLDMDGESPGRLPASFEILDQPVKLIY